VFGKRQSALLRMAAQCDETRLAVGLAPSSPSHGATVAKRVYVQRLLAWRPWFVSGISALNPERFVQPAHQRSGCVPMFYPLCYFRVTSTFDPRPALPLRLCVSELF